MQAQVQLAQARKAVRVDHAARAGWRRRGLGQRLGRRHGLGRLLLECELPSAASASSDSSSADSSTSLVTITAENKLQVVAGFSEIDAAKIRPGQAATVTVDALPNEKFAAHVLSVDTLSTVTSNVVTYNVTFVLDNPLREGEAGHERRRRRDHRPADNVLNLTSSAVTDNRRTLDRDRPAQRRGRHRLRRHGSQRRQHHRDRERPERDRSGRAAR